MLRYQPLEAAFSDTPPEATRRIAVSVEAEVSSSQGRDTERLGLSSEAGRKIKRESQSDQCLVHLIIYLSGLGLKLLHRVALYSFALYIINFRTCKKVSCTVSYFSLLWNTMASFANSN
jgi:hypothetical protein